VADLSPTPLSLGDVAAQVAHLMAVGQLTRARELAASLLAQEPDDPGAHVVLSSVLLALAESEAALGAAEQAVRLAPDDERGHLQRAHVLLSRAAFAEAERSVLQAIALEAEDPRGHLLYARILGACEREAQGLAAVENAIALDPDDAEAHQLRAHLLLHARPRDWRLSEAAARRGLALDPEDADAHAVLGNVCLRARRVEEAERCFRDALTLDPQNALALRGLAEALSARHVLYRPFLRYSTWMEQASMGMRVAVVAGAWAIASGLRGTFRDNLAAQLVDYVYIAFCAYTWFATPITRFILGRQYPWFRQVHD
jgi:tetratricopeptide (TPR) repeat protein